MAIQVKSVNQILADAFRKVVLETPITSIPEGSTTGVILEAASLQDFQNQLAVLKVLESSNLQSLIGTDLDNKAIEMNIPNGVGGYGRIPAKRATGSIRIGSNFTKLTSAIYLGKTAPFAGALTVYLQDCTGWPSSGSFYLGRGTANEEGPIQYTSLVNNTTFFTLTLSPSTPLVKNHAYSEIAILAQGGLRSIPAGTVVIAPASAGSTPVQFTTDVDVQLLDGEASIDVNVTCSVFGEDGSVSAGAIKLFGSTPFSGATVTNPVAYSNGFSAEGDEQLRTRIKNYVASLARGVKTAISSALLNLRDPVSGKTITSLNIVEPTTTADSAKIYVDDGSGLEPALRAQAFERLLSNSSGQEVLFKTSNFPITPSVINGTREGPYALADGMYIDVEIDGVSERYRINSSEYINLSSVTIDELIRAFNSKPTTSGQQNIAFRTFGGRKYLSIFDLSGKAETLRVLPSELQKLLGLPTDEIRPLFLYKKNKLLSFKGKTGIVFTSDYPWSDLQAADIQNVPVIVDGVVQQITVANTDFIQFNTTVGTATLEQWVAVLKKKIAGANIYISGNRLAFATWQEFSPEGSIEIPDTKLDGSASTWIGINKMWSADSALLSVGSSSDYELNRMSGQIKLVDKPNVGDDITVGSLFTRAEIQSPEATTGIFNVSPNNFGTSKIIVGVDGEFEIRDVSVSGSTTLTPVVLSANSNLVRLYSSDTSLFTPVLVDDFIYLARDASVSKKLATRNTEVYKVKRRGLMTRGTDETFAGASFTFSAPGVGNVVTVTVTTSSPHKLIVDQVFEVPTGTVSLAGGSGLVDADIEGLRTVTSVASPTIFSFQIISATASPVTPNFLNVFVEQDSFVDVEASKLQKEAFVGEFNDAPVTYTDGSLDVTVYLPRHDFVNGTNINVASVSAALAAVFSGSGNCTGTRTVKNPITADSFTLSFSVNANASLAIPGVITLDGNELGSVTPYDVSEGMLYAFKSTNATPQIIDFGPLASASADDIVSSVNSQLIGASAYKISPRQIALRSSSFNEEVSTIAVLASVGSAVNAFQEQVAGSIQPHVAAKESQFVSGGFAYIKDVDGPTNSANFYSSRGALKFKEVQTVVVDEAANPTIEASAATSEYPKGLQEFGISGRNYDLVSRNYNNNVSAPFAGFARGEDVIKPTTQDVPGTNEDYSSTGVRLHDLSLSFTDKVVIQMDLDEVNKTTSVPMFKRALTEAIAPFGQGSGSQIEFTLKDPEDEVSPGTPRPFFEVNSPYRNFDFTDFNILFAPTLIHTVYSTLPYSGNPPDAFVIRSSQFGPAHELRFGFLLPTAANVSQLKFSHLSYEEDTKVIQIVNCTLTSGNTVVGSEYSGLYTITPSDYTSPTGAEIVKLSISALGLNLGGVYTIGNILNIGGSLPYSGSYLIIGTPDNDTVEVSAPGLRASSYSPLSYDGALALLSSFPLTPKSMTDIKSTADAYFSDNPVITMEITPTSTPANAVIYPTYHTHGNSVENENLTTIADSLNYHSKRANFGSIAHIHTYSAADNKIIALVQNEQAVLPTSADILSTGFSSTYANQPCYLIPANSKALDKWMNFTAISPLSIQSEIKRVQNETKLQLNSLNNGSEGAVRVTGVTANASSATVKSAPFKFGRSLKLRTDFSPAQTFPRGTLAKITNSVSAPILRAYRNTPSVLAGDSAITSSNTTDPSLWFRTSTVVAYSRPTPNLGRFVFRKSLSGLLGGETVDITKVNSFIAKLEISAGSGVFNARVGDMLVLRGTQNTSVPLVSYTSIFNADNACIPISGDLTDKYIGYPVVHVASPTEIYVLAPNITAETVTARATNDAGTMSSLYQTSGPNIGQVRITPLTNINDFSIGDAIEVSGFINAANNGRFYVMDVDALNGHLYVSGRTSSIGDETAQSGISIIRQTTEFMFVPMMKAEKNIRTNYKAGAPKNTNWKISANEEVFYRVKDIGFGFGYLDCSFTSHENMFLNEMSVSSDDYLILSDAFDSSNRGRFKIIAHNGTNGIVFRNPNVVDEVIQADLTIDDGIYGTNKWKIGPIDDADTTSVDKRHVRIVDGDSVFEQDKLVVTSPSPGTTDWFDASVIGRWSIERLGINRDYDAFVEATIPNATSTSKTLTLANSAFAFSFAEGLPYEGYKWVAGYASNDVSQEEAETFLLPQTLDYKISPAFNTKLTAMHKLGYDDETTVGVDGYKYYTELIAEAHKVLDGSSSNTIAYPGVRAAGTTIEVNAPLVKSIQISFQIESRDGVSINSIKNPVRSVVSSYVNSLGVSKPVVLSEVIKKVQEVPGVRSVVITTTLPAAVDGVIKVGSYEVPRISKPEDVLV